MITKLIDALNDIINAGADTGTVQAHLKTIREQAEVLEREYASFQLKAAVPAIPAIPAIPAVSAVSAEGAAADPMATDACPHCQQLSGVLQGRDESVGEAGQAIKVHHYQCSNKDCGKTYDKQVAQT